MYTHTCPQHASRCGLASELALTTRFRECRIGAHAHAGTFARVRICVRRGLPCRWSLDESARARERTVKYYAITPPTQTAISAII